MKRLLVLVAVIVVLVLTTASTTPRAYCGWAGDTRAFVKVGDSISASPYYLHPLANPDRVQIEPALTSLWASIGYFRKASWERSSLSAQNGMTSQGLLDPARGNGMTLLQLEYDAMNARAALIMIGTNDPATWTDSQFSQRNITQIVEYTLGRGMTVILFTLPVNANKDVTVLNTFIRQLAYQKGLYLVDSSSVVIGADGVHPTFSPVGLEAVLMPETYGFGYTMRNKQTLQALDYLRMRCGWW